MPDQIRCVPRDRVHDIAAHDSLEIFQRHCEKVRDGVGQLLPGVEPPEIDRRSTSTGIA